MVAVGFLAQRIYSRVGSNAGCVGRGRAGKEHLKCGGRAQRLP